MNVWLHVVEYKRQFSLLSLCKSLKAQLFVDCGPRRKIAIGYSVTLKSHTWGLQQRRAVVAVLWKVKRGVK